VNILNLMNVNFLIAKLQEMAVAAQKKEENRKWSKLSTHVTELKRWQDSGMKGECPVDYKTLGIRLPATGAARQAVTDSGEGESTSSETVAVSVEDEMQDLTLRENLSRAEGLLGKDEFASAIPLAETILKQKSPDDIHQRAQQVVNEAKSKREAQIKSLLELAKKAFDDKAWDNTEKYYRQALELDEEDQRAFEGLNALMSSKSEAEQKAHLEEIKINLQALNKIDVLANAIRETEQLIARKKADDELVQLYQAGKDRWDELREKQGTTTTKARVGNLESRAEAVHEYEQYIIHNQMTVWDATLNTFIPTDEALKDARRNWEYFSHQETQKRLNEVDRNLPHNLDWARQRLVDAVNQQYYDSEDTGKKNPLGFSFFEPDRSDLQARFVEIERLIKNRDQAEALRERTRTVSPEEGLNLLMEARNLWKHLEGIDKRIDEQRELVAGLLADRMEAKMREANALLEFEKFNDAREIASEAAGIPKRLVGPKVTMLEKSVEKVNKFFGEIERRQRISLEFDRFEKEIYRLLQEPDSRQDAYSVIKKLEKQPKFKGYARFDRLRRIVISKSISDLMEGIATAINREEYDKAVYCIVEARKKGNTKLSDNTQIKQELESLMLKNMDIARKCLEEMDFLRAGAILQPPINLLHYFPRYSSDILDEFNRIAEKTNALDLADKQLGQAKRFIESGKPTEEVDKILQSIVGLEYYDLPAERLKTEAVFLLTRQNLDGENYDPLEKRLLHLATMHPMDLNIQSIFVGYQQLCRKDKVIKELHSRARAWYRASIITAIILLALCIYIILITVNKDDPLSSLASLTSLIPLLATKLVYDQSAKADELANNAYKEKLDAENDLYKRIREL